jgi:arylsulfatase A-like enzyme
MSLYGYSRKTTPNIDNFAKDAFVANNYIASSYLTPISEAGVHTGFYPQGNHVISFSSELNTNTPTIAEILRANGFRTAAFGNSPEFSLKARLGNSFKRGYEIYNIDSSRSYKNLPDINQIISWVKKDNNPFFLWIPLGGAHFPYGDVPDRFVDTSYSGFLKNDSLGFLTIGYIYKDKMFRNADALKNPSWMETRQTAEIKETRKLGVNDLQYIKDKYDDGIFYVDEYLKLLFEFLKESSLLDNTIVVIQSEHGEDMGEHAYIMHYDIWDTTVHVPLIVKLPKANGSISEALISGVDVLPTILDEVEIRNVKTDGKSFLELIKNPDVSEFGSEVFISRTPLWETVKTASTFWEQTENLKLKNARSPVQDLAVRNKDWKLIHRIARDTEKEYSWYSFISSDSIERQEFELYNLKMDAGEQENVFEENKNRQDVLVLLEKLYEFERQSKKKLELIKESTEAQPYF